MKTLMWPYIMNKEPNVKGRIFLISVCSATKYQYKTNKLCTQAGKQAIKEKQARKHQPAVPTTKIGIAVDDATSQATRRVSN